MREGVCNSDVTSLSGTALKRARRLGSNFSLRGVTFADRFPAAESY
jgi:hypothetical protein